jgi:FKBP-type peptidyl-prolyl cis-trans isomerase SlyD
VNDWVICFQKQQRMKTVIPHHIVELKYELHEGGKQGALLEIMDEHWPLKFYYGAGAMLPAFEAHLACLTEGSDFAFTLRAEEAYGAINPEKIREVPLSAFNDDMWFQPDQMEVGDRLYVKHPTVEGKGELGVITELLPQGFLVDFNHALAGKDLYFTGQILYIRAPRAEEQAAKRYIEPNGIRSNSRLSEGPDL